MNELRGPGRGVFAGALLIVGGVLNVVYGAAAIGNSDFFVHDAHYIFGSLKTWGWVALVIGILELLASLSLFRGGIFGRYFAIGVGALAAIEALFEIPAYPLWSLAVFGLSLWIIAGLTISGGPNDLWERTAVPPAPSQIRPPRGPV
jgi:hypothetical protein